MGKVLKFGGIGCGGLLVLAIVIVVISAALGGTAASPTAVAATATARPVATATSAIARQPEDAKEKISVPVATAVPTAEPKLRPTAAPKPAAIGAMGERRESGGIAITVKGAEWRANLGQFLEAKAGNKYIVADVLIENVSRETAPYNPLYFKVKSSEGYEYSSAIFSMDEKSLKSGELTKGDTVRGTVAFEVPEGAKTLVLSYQPLVILGGYDTIRVQITE